VASERKIAANRRNAGKSTGPRSHAGKKRAGQNALRHGLTQPISGAELTKQIDELARKIAGGTADGRALEHARTAAEAELELLRVRRIRLALIEHASALGSLKTATHFRSPYDEVSRPIAMDDWMENSRGIRTRTSRLRDPTTSMPQSEPDRTSEAVRLLLPDLIKLDRFETRAANRRDRAIRNLGGK
jgi:hypothetical protein